MKNTLKNYLDILVRNKVINDVIPNVNIELGNETKGSIHIGISDIYLRKNSNYVRYETSMSNNSIDNIFDLPVEDIQLYFEEPETNLKYYKKLNVKIGIGYEDFKPSANNIMKKIFYDAEKYNGNYYYCSGDYCFYNDVLYKCICSGVTFGKFNKLCWHKAKPIKCTIVIHCTYLSNKITNSLCYSRDLINPQLYSTLVKEGSTVISYKSYNNAVDYVESHRLNKGCTPEQYINKDVENALNLSKGSVNTRFINMSEGVHFYIIEILPMIEKRRLSKI